MNILELLINVFDSFSFPDTSMTGCMSEDLPKPPSKPDFLKNLKPAIVLNLIDCAKAHEKIEKGDSKKLTYFVSYSEVVNEETGRKTTVGQVHVPFHKVRVCVSTKNEDEK